MATRLEELEERLAVLEAGTVGYTPYEEEYAPYEEEFVSYEEEMVVGAMEEEFSVEGMTQEEIRTFSDTAEALETGQLQWDELTSVEQMGFWNSIKKATRVVKRVVKKVKPYWKAAKPYLSKKLPWIKYIPFEEDEEEMAAAPTKILKPILPIIPMCKCPPGYRTVPVGYRCVRTIRPPLLKTPIPKPPVLRK